jgi:glycine cleavage system H lipoate-binding protein
MVLIKVNHSGKVVIGITSTQGQKLGAVLMATS